MSQFAGTSPQQAAAQEFQQYVTNWLATFNTNKSMIGKTQVTPVNVQQNASLLLQLVPDLVTYLQTRGVPSLFTNPSASPSNRQFSQRGLQALYFILLGPVSFLNPLMIMQPGYSYVGATEAPTNWPQGGSPGPN
jgi:hypothetical protein